MTSSDEWADAVSRAIGEVDAALAAVPDDAWQRPAAAADLFLRETGRIGATPEPWTYAAAART